jgi:hypothetical protein
MSEPKQTNVDDFVGELEAGIFKERLAIMLTEAALGAVMHNRKGKVNVSFDITRVNESGQVMICANLKNTKPIRIHATVVARVQDLLETGASIEKVCQKTGLSFKRASALIDTIQGQAQMGRVA